MKASIFFILLVSITGTAKAQDSFKIEYQHTKTALAEVLKVERATLTANRDLHADAFQILWSMNREYARMGFPPFNPYEAKAEFFNIDGCYSTALRGINVYAKVTPLCLAQAIFRSR